MAPYRYLEHTADIGVSATGETLAEVFESAAEGLAALLCGADKVRELESRPLSVQAPDLASLLVEWLNEVNFQFEAGHFAFRRFRVTAISETRLSATGFGEPFDPRRHRVGEQVKAATYHGLSVEQRNGHWNLQVILDV